MDDNCRIGFGFDAVWIWQVKFSTSNYETEDITSIHYTDRIPCYAVKKLVSRWKNYGDCQGEMMDDNNKTDDYKYPTG